MKLQLIKFLRYLMSFVETEDPRLSRVRELVTLADSLADSSGKVVTGERKRNQVFHQLVSEFPISRKRDLSLLIEQVLQKN